MYVTNIPYDYIGAITGDKVVFSQATALALQGSVISAEQRGIRIPKDRTLKAESITFPVEIDAQYAASLYANCRALQSQGYGPCDFALIHPLGVAGAAKFFLTADMIAEHSESISLVLRLTAKEEVMYLNTLTGQVGKTVTTKRLCVKFMENTMLSIDASGQVFSAQEELLEITVEEVVEEFKSAVSLGRPCRINGKVIFPKPYRTSSVKMYTDVIEIIAGCITTSKLGAAW